MVGRRQLERLLIRGLLHQAPLQMNDFLSLLETEGYDREEIRSLLEEDITNGYVKKVIAIIQTYVCQWSQWD